MLLSRLCRMLPRGVPLRCGECTDSGWGLSSCDVWLPSCKFGGCCFVQRSGICLAAWFWLFRPRPGRPSRQGVMWYCRRTWPGVRPCPWCFGTRWRMSVPGIPGICCWRIWRDACNGSIHFIICCGGSCKRCMNSRPTAGCWKKGWMRLGIRCCWYGFRPERRTCRAGYWKMEFEYMSIL